MDAITRTDVIAVLAPIWTAKPGESSKVLARMRTVFDWSSAHGHCVENPCTTSVIKAALPSQERTRTHHEAVPYRDAAGALRAITECRTVPSARACARFLILTAARSTEARGAQ